MKNLLLIFISLFIIKIILDGFLKDLYGEDFTNINLKYAQEFFDGDYGSFLELENISQFGNWDMYGFLDLRIENQNLNYDFYKFKTRYNILGKNLIYLSFEAKDTYSFDSDLFFGIGTRILNIINVNFYYFADNVDKPYSLQFDWYSKLMDLPYNMNITQGGWVDVDFFNNIGGVTDVSTQFYEGIALNKDTYAIELGYKYWKNTFGVKDDNSNIIYLYLIKRI